MTSSLGQQTRPSLCSPLACVFQTPKGHNIPAASSRREKSRNPPATQIIRQMKMEGRERQGCLSSCPSLAVGFLCLAGCASFQRLPEPPSAHSRWNPLPIEKPSPCFSASYLMIGQKKKINSGAQLNITCLLIKSPAFFLPQECISGTAKHCLTHLREMPGGRHLRTKAALVLSTSLTDRFPPPQLSYCLSTRSEMTWLILQLGKPKCLLGSHSERARGHARSPDPLCPVYISTPGYVADPGEATPSPAQRTSTPVAPVCLLGSLPLPGISPGFLVTQFG